MKLTEVRIASYKSVTDSGKFKIDPKVTALVGKNEAGKSAVLEAMYRLNPIPSGHPTTFEELRDYPRRYRARDRDKIPTIRPIEMRFELDDDDLAAVAAEYGDHALASKVVHVSRKYGDDSLCWDDEIDEVAIAHHLVDAKGLDPERYKGDSLETLISSLRTDPDVNAATSLADNLETRDLDAEVRELLQTQRLPKFQYFDEYNILPGSVSIHRLQTVEENQLNPGERTALALLRLAGVDTKEFSEAEYEPRKAALEAAANQLTDELFQYWTQNQDLSVELDIEFRRNQKTQSGAVEPWLQIRVRNQRHRVTLNMSERSKGFIWFFSFLAAFSEFANEEQRVILLDEPGLTLHAKAQNDLLRYIDDRLASNDQVVYSTHSLFMIQPTKLERCRTVEDIGDIGTKVSDDIWAARPDTVFPLLGAIGVDMAQTLVIGPDQLLVEGPSDVIYLTVLSDYLRSKGRTSLDLARWTLTPVGGLDKVPTFIALLGGSNLNLTVLLDVAAGGNQRIATLVSRGLLESEHVVPLTEFTETNEADIEDMFETDWYLNLLRLSGTCPVTESDLSGGGRIVKRIEALLGHRYDHFAPANYLLRSRNNLLDGFDEATEDRFVKLFERLNALLS